MSVVIKPGVIVAPAPGNQDFCVVTVVAQVPGAVLTGDDLKRLALAASETEAARSLSREGHITSFRRQDDHVLAVAIGPGGSTRYLATALDRALATADPAVTSAPSRPSIDDDVEELTDAVFRRHSDSQLPPLAAVQPDDIVERLRDAPRTFVAVVPAEQVASAVTQLVGIAGSAPQQRHKDLLPGGIDLPPLTVLESMVPAGPSVVVTTPVTSATASERALLSSLIGRILGGTPSALLPRTLEDRGYGTYSVEAAIGQAAGHDVLSVRVWLSDSVLEDVTEIVLDTLSRLVSLLADRSLISGARRSLSAGYHLSHFQSAALAAGLASFVTAGFRPEDYLEATAVISQTSDDAVLRSVAEIERAGRVIVVTGIPEGADRLRAWASRKEATS